MPLFVDFKEDKPYFFVSYSHQDTERIAAVIQKMQEQGCNFWNDELIPAATDWDGQIAAHVSGCSGFIAFITANYAASDNCLDELNYSRDLDKPRLLIYLDKVDLPEGMRMRLSRLQAVEWFRYPEETALKKVMRTDFIRSCLKESRRQEAVSSASEDDAEVSSETGRNRSSLRKWILLAVCAALLTVGIVFFRSGAKEPDAMTAAPENYHIRLQVKDDMTVKDFNTAAEIIKERLDLLADGESYSMTVGKETIDLSIPRTCFAGLAPENVLRCYISREINLYVTDFQEGGYAEIPREWIAEITVKEGRLEGIDVSDLDIGDEDYTYLTIRLTAQAAAAIAEQKIDPEELVFAQDIEEYSKWFWYHTYPGEDSSTYYVINDDPGEKFTDLIQYNLTHEPLSEGLYYTVEIDGAWENPSAVEDAGENEVSRADLKEDTPLVWKYTMYTDDPLSEGEWLDTRKRFCRIMDSLEVPYVFGYDEDYSVRFMSNTDHINSDILHLILQSQSSFALQGGAEKLSLQDSTSMQITEEGENFYLDLLVDPDNVSRVQQVLASAEEYDTPTVLTAGDIPCMYASDPVLINDQILRFDICALSGDTSVTAENRWILNFLQTLYNTDASGIYYTLDQAQIDCASASGDQLMTGRTALLQEETAKIQAMFPDAEVNFDSTNINIGLHGEVSGMTAEEFASALTEICSSLSKETLYTMKVWVFCSGDSGNRYSYIKGIFEPVRYISSAENPSRRPYTLTLYSCSEFGENSSETIMEQLKSDPVFENFYISAVE